MRCDLLAELATKVEVPDNIPYTNEPLQPATVIDAISIVQTVRSGGAKTFGLLAEKYAKVFSSSLGVNGCNRVDMVFDRYDKSIKAGERAMRGSSSELEINISGPITPIAN